MKWTKFGNFLSTYDFESHVENSTLPSSDWFQSKCGHSEDTVGRDLQVCVQGMYETNVFRAPALYWLPHYTYENVPEDEQKAPLASSISLQSFECQFRVCESAQIIWVAINLFIFLA